MYDGLKKFFMTILYYYLLKGAHGIKCIVFNRWGGVSPPIFNELNVSFHVGDKQEYVIKNREIISEFFDVPFLISSKQVHGDGIIEIKAPGKFHEISGFDALMTNRPGIALMVQHADCQAVILHDPVNKAVANIHCGWRGSVSGILSKTVIEMGKKYNTRPKDLLAAIGPSIGPCCYEFKDWEKLLPEDFHTFVSDDHLDLRAVSLWQLKRAGLLEEKIEISKTCTFCSRDFFSHRRDGTTGRNATIVMLKA